VATRFYLPATGTAPVTVTPSTAWNTTTGFGTLPLNSAKGGTAVANGTARAKVSQAAVQNRLDRVYVSQALPAQTISGTFSAVIRAIASASTNDGWLNIMIRAVSSDGATERGVLYAGSTATTSGASGTNGPENQEIGTTLTTRIKSALTLTPVTLQANDRLVVEVGFRATTANTNTITFSYGDPTAGTDLALTAGVATANVPWVEFSQDLTLAPPIDTFTDDFTTYDTAKWMSYGTAPTITNGQLTFPGSTTFSGIASLSKYDLTGTSCSVELVQKVANGTEYVYFQLNRDASNKISFSVREGGSLQARRTLAGVEALIGTAVTYNAATHRWLRISEASGTLTWATSPDGATWATLATATVASLFPITAVEVELGSGYVTSGSGTTIFDNLNILPAVGADLTASLADDAAITDSATTVLDARRDLVDSAGATDSVSTQLAAVRDLVDAAAITDSASSVLAADRQLSDSAAITDSASWAISQVTERTLTDSAAITDLVSVQLAALRDLTDAAAITDAASTQLAAQRQLADSAALTDSASTALAAVRPLADSAAISDWASWTLTNADTTVQATADTSATLQPLTPSSRYRVRVRARNTLGESAWSAPETFATTAGVTTLPQGAVTGTLVSTDSTTATNPDARLGINTNMWLDNQAQRTGTPRTLTAALGDLKPRIMRYPGGEKSDGTTFFQAANQGAPGQAGPNPRLNRIGTDAWPSNDPSYWTTPTAAGTWAAGRQPYALQTFLADCAATGAEPIIVLALDGIYPAAPAGAGIKPTKAEMITNAVEMVRWLNVTNSYGVKLFEIGNEPWLNPATPYLGGQSDPTIYAADFADVAAAMKAVDPTIKVGANGDSVAYFDGILNTAAASVDFLTVHPYDTYGMAYSTYQSATLAASQLNAAVTSLNKQPAQHRDRIFITTTETAHLAQNNTDANAYNNLGSAIITAHLLGLQMNDPRLRHVIFWNTRWIYNTQATKLAYDALAPDNSLLPTGRALQFLGQLSGRMVPATIGTAGTGLIAYASQVPTEGRSSVLIINRTGTARSGTVGMAGAVAATTRRLSGTAVTDTAPTVTGPTAVAVTGGVTASITCPANTLTVVDFTY
jgi:alpha-N-arabinofuranosidase